MNRKPAGKQGKPRKPRTITKAFLAIPVRVDMLQSKT
jgi:hypothetical protein